MSGKFTADKKLIETVKTVVTEQAQNAVIGLVCSGDQFINGAGMIALIRQDFPEVAAVEMEAAAIAHTCYALMCRLSLFVQFPMWRIKSHISLLMSFYRLR